MIRHLTLFLWWAGMAGGVAQVRQGGAYQIVAETLDSGGGLAGAGAYSVRSALPSLGATASGGVYTVLSGFTGQLGSGGTGSGPAAFLAWQTALFGGPAEPGAGPNEDIDRDGVVNLLEFAFNLPPLLSSHSVAEPGATGGLPLIRAESFGTDLYFTMEYIRRKNAGLFQPETSTTLNLWTPASYIVLSGPESISPVYERMKLRLGSPIQPGAPVFYRLSVFIQ